MKLQKALEKAKQARSQQTEEDSKSTLVGNDESSDEKAGAQGWEKPTYSESRHVTTDLDRMEDNRLVGMFSDAPEIDAYKVLRTQIEQRTKEKGWNTVMVTSIQPGEGKTLTAINLSLTFARAFSQTVLLVDCDLKRQNIHRYLGIESNAGLAECLMDDRPLKDIIIWPGVDKMTLISGGRPMHESTEILGSPRMKSLVSEMKNRYDDRYVIFDVPSILAGADAIAFAPLVDCIIIVVEEGKTSMKDIEKALKLIPQDKFLGFVVNKQRISKAEKHGLYSLRTD